MRGDGRAELTGYDFASISCRGGVYMKTRLDCEKSTGVFCGSPKFHSSLSSAVSSLLPADLSGPLHKCQVCTAEVVNVF